MIMFENSIFLERLTVFIITMITFIILRHYWHGPIAWLTISSLISSVIFGLFLVLYFVPFGVFTPQPESNIIFGIGLYILIISWTVCFFMFSLELRKRRIIIMPRRKK